MVMQLGAKAVLEDETVVRDEDNLFYQDVTIDHEVEEKSHYKKSD